jgi:hypothetical protein
VGTHECRRLSRPVPVWIIAALRHRRFFSIEELTVLKKSGFNVVLSGRNYAQTRMYLNDFAQAVQNGDANAVEQRILAKYPECHVKQFLTVFSIPAFFPAVSSA